MAMCRPVQSQLPGMSVQRSDDLTIVDSGLGSDTFNKVLSSRMSGAGVDQNISQALSHFRDNGRPFTWWVGPCSRPVDLEFRLLEHGLHEQEYELGMALDLARMRPEVDLPTQTIIQPVSTEHQLMEFAKLLADLSIPPDEAVTSFYQQSASLVLSGDGPMRFFIAYVRDEPAAVSELFLGGGVAGVHMVATRDDFRRRGLGMALTWTALHEGKRRGMRTGVLQAAPEGQPVYEKLGFEPCGRFVEYAPVPS